MEIPRYWARNDQYLRLKGTRMADDRIAFPPRKVEPRSVETYDFDTVVPTSESSLSQNPEVVKTGEAEVVLFSTIAKLTVPGEAAAD